MRSEQTDCLRFALTRSVADEYEFVTPLSTIACEHEQVSYNGASRGGFFFSFFPWQKSMFGPGGLSSAAPPSAAPPAAACEHRLADDTLRMSTPVHCFLCCFQSLFWHALSQYTTTRHWPHRDPLLVRSSSPRASTLVFWIGC